MVRLGSAVQSIPGASCNSSGSHAMNACRWAARSPSLKLNRRSGRRRDGPGGPDVCATAEILAAAAFLTDHGGVAGPVSGGSSGSDGAEGEGGASATSEAGRGDGDGEGDSF